MSREKFLTVAVIFLLVLNTGIVAFLFFSRPPHPPELWKMVVNEVGFDGQQEQAYFALRDAHRQKMNHLDREFAKKLELYMMQLKGNPDQVMEDSLASEVANIEKAKAEATLQHFRQVKGLCRPDQFENFDRIVPKLLPIMLPNKDPKRRPNR